MFCRFTERITLAESYLIRETVPTTSELQQGTERMLLLTADGVAVIQLECLQSLFCLF